MRLPPTSDLLEDVEQDEDDGETADSDTECREVVHLRTFFNDQVIGRIRFEPAKAGRERRAQFCRTFACIERAFRLGQQIVDLKDSQRRDGTIESR